MAEVLENVINSLLRNNDQKIKLEKVVQFIKNPLIRKGDETNKYTSLLHDDFMMMDEPLIDGFQKIYPRWKS